MTGLGLSLVRGAVTSPFKRAGRPGQALPAGRVVLAPSPTAPGPLAAYNRVCGFAGPGPLPLTYPHVLGFPSAMRVMTRRDFPLPVLGLVHTWIEITGHRELQPDDALQLTVHAAALMPHRRGTEVTVVTEARLGDALVWESRSGYLSRHPTGEAGPPDPPSPSGGTQQAPAPGPAVAGLPAVAEWHLPTGLGRRYGAASGDRNPIHLHPLTARLFGFPRHIAHGMWTVARCLAQESGHGPGDSGRIRSVRADFRAPVLLPATVTYAASGPDFEVRDGSRVHLTGRLSRRD
ncbi:MaoC/PaaZ C-terminal domain-containing protein [Streptomyces sp. NPDC001822]|uniref:MaoC/PaaZ C-terminal domain-containing protein n=1 Tax=Streptomyces sp. NPDC001822 TaxID=3364614 RepID=UPI0036A9D86E